MTSKIAGTGLARNYRKSRWTKLLDSKQMHSEANPPVQHLTTISIFFSDCGVLKRNFDLLASLGFHQNDPISIQKSSRLLGNYQTARISSGSLILELISDPVFSRLRKSYGKRNTFARVVEVRRSSSSKLESQTFPPKGSSIFSGLYPLTALKASFPHNIPLFTVSSSRGHSSTAVQSTASSEVKKISRHFDSVKEIIIPCSTANYENMDIVQSILTGSFGATPLGRRYPGLFELKLTDKEKLVIRTAPTNTCTIILKVDNLLKSSNMLRTLEALGDSMGYNGTLSNGQIQIKMPGLDSGVEFRICDSEVVSAFYVEPPQSVVADTIPEMQSSRVLMEGGSGRTEQKAPADDLLAATTGDCWKEVRVQLRNATK